MITPEQIILRKNYCSMKNSLIYSNLGNFSSVPAVIIKGEPLSLAAYGKVGQRISTDIDFLLDKKSIYVVEKYLVSKGYKSTSNSRFETVAMITQTHQTAPMCKIIMPFGESLVDLNFSLFWGEYEGPTIDVSDFISNPTIVEIYGNKVKTLSPIKLLIQYILHCYRDLNSLFIIAERGEINIELFHDIYHLIKNNHDSVAPEILFEECKKYYIVPYAFYVLYYTEQFYHDGFLKKHIDLLKTKDGVELLNSYGLKDSERKIWKYDFQMRLKSKSLFDLIKGDLDRADLEKIEFNRHLLSHNL